MSEMNTATFYVATDGNDAWSGRLAEPNAPGTDGPLATLKGARGAVRKARGGAAGAGAVAMIRGGTFRLTETFELTEADSGTAEQPMHYAALQHQRSPHGRSHLDGVDTHGRGSLAGGVGRTSGVRTLTELSVLALLRADRHTRITCV